jgi:hypothetical protein
MIFRGKYAGEALTVSLKPGVVSLLFGTDEVLTYDRAGRLWRALHDGTSARRGLDGTFLLKHPASGMRRRQPAAAMSELIERCAGRVQALLTAIEAGQVVWEHAPPPELIPALQQAAGFDPAAAAASSAAYRRVYDPVGILPPDQYIALVLQATIGCSFNTCTFCDFYRNRRFRIKSEVEFREHAQAVREFIGAALPMRRSIFLGEANALTIPLPRLVRLLQIARETFGPLPIHAFQDGFSGQRKQADDYRRLADLGLRRVSIGLESGHDPLLQFVRKPGSAAEAAETVRHLKQAGVAVNLIVLLGLGGATFAEAHRADTRALLAAMPLDAQDIVYFSELQPQPGSDYPGQVAAAEIRPLDAAELRVQQAAIEAGFQRPGGPRSARYDIGEFIY